MTRLLWVLVATWLALVSGAKAAPFPDIVLTGQVTEADREHYLELPFEVPVNVTSLKIAFSHDGKPQRTTLDLGLADPVQFRGWSGGERSTFQIATSAATPSYLAGPLASGTWHLIIGVPNIRPGVTTSYRAQITLGAAADLAPVQTPLKAGPGWYRGDLHSHSAHSDGRCPNVSAVVAPCPVFRVVEAAASRHLDFLVLSDHNTLSQAAQIGELQPYFDQTLLIPGEELTTFRGHAGAVGVSEPIDFRIGGTHAASVNGMINAVHRAGGIFVINHPTLPSGEVCMGCGWTFADTDYAQVDGIEVVNGGTLALTKAADGPFSGLGFWRALLDKGYHLTGVGGSDSHSANPGVPTTVVHAESLSIAGILHGLKAGHVFVDVDGTADRLLDVTVSDRDGSWQMGDVVPIRRGQTRPIKLHVLGAAGGTIELLGNGQRPATRTTAPLLTSDDTVEYRLTGDGQDRWFQVQVRDVQGRLILIGNPIYLVGPRR